MKRTARTPKLRMLGCRRTERRLIDFGFRSTFVIGWALWGLFEFRVQAYKAIRPKGLGKRAEDRG